jgi:fluoride ion exporter CrcB/FEX
MGIYGFILVFIGGGLGSALRHGVNMLALRLVGTAYPWGTLAINVLATQGQGSRSSSASAQGSRRTKPGLTDGARFALRNAEDQE